MNIKVQVNKQTVVRLALVGIIPLFLILLFLWAGGWLTPERLTSDKLVTVLHNSRVAFIKAIGGIMLKACACWEFISNGNASTLSRLTIQQRRNRGNRTLGYCRR